MGYAKSYDLVFSTPMKAGNLNLKPGEYSMKLKGNTAIFTRLDTEKQFTAPVKIESAATKHTVTEVLTKTGSVNTIQKIELGGSATDVEFGD
jgi:hypothetical protein